MKKFAMGMLISAVLVSGAMAATFNAAVSRGNWTSGATWGNGGSTPGTDWPFLAGDIFQIPTGDTVVLDTVCLNELGASNITGVLIADTTTARTLVGLTFANTTLWVKNGGHLILGHSTMGKINNGRKVRMIWNTTADLAQGIRIGNGGKMTVFGDSMYVGGAECDTTALSTSAENSDADSIIVTTADMSAKWKAGDQIYIRLVHMPSATTTANSDVAARTIIGFGSLDTVYLGSNLAAPSTGFGTSWKALVLNPNHNIGFRKLAADTVLGDGSAHQNTNRPIVWDSNTVAGNVNLSHCTFTGFYGLRMSGVINLTDVTFRNGYNGVYGFSDASIGTNYNGGHLIGLTSGIYYQFMSYLKAWVYACINGTQIYNNGTTNINVFACQYGHYGESYGTISGNTFGCYCGCYWSFGHPGAGAFSGRLFANFIGEQGFDCEFRNAEFGWNMAGVADSNGVDFRVYLPYSADNLRLYNCKNPRSDYKVLRNTSGNPLYINIENDSQTVGRNRIIEAYGVVTNPVCDGTNATPSADPYGGAARCLMLTCTSALDTNNYVQAWDKYAVRIYATTGISKTYTFVVQTTYTTLSAGLLELSAQYLDGATTGHEAEIRSTNAVNVRATAADWTQAISVTVNPSQTGWVTLRIKLKKYESGKVVYIWPKFTIS